MGPCQPYIKAHWTLQPGIINLRATHTHRAWKLLQSFFAAAAVGSMFCCSRLEPGGSARTAAHLSCALLEVATCSGFPPPGEGRHTLDHATFLSLSPEESCTKVKKQDVLFHAFWKEIVWAKYIKHTVLQSRKFTKGNGEQDLQASRSCSEW